ncbi:hypothetical protein CsatA_002941 [Cannabis sativa]
MPWFDHTSSLVEAQRFLSFSMSIFICFGFSCWLNQVSSSFQALDENVKMKLSQFCHVPKDNIIILYDVSHIWHIPLLLSDQKAHEAIFQVLNLQRGQKHTWVEPCVLGQEEHIFKLWTANHLNYMGIKAILTRDTRTDMRLILNWLGVLKRVACALQEKI